MNDEQQVKVTAGFYLPILLQKESQKDLKVEMNIIEGELTSDFCSVTYILVQLPPETSNTSIFSLIFIELHYDIFFNLVLNTKP